MLDRGCYDSALDGYGASTTRTQMTLVGGTRSETADIGMGSVWGSEIRDGLDRLEELDEARHVKT